MKLLAATGFEPGSTAWDYKNKVTSETFVRRFIESITGGELTTRAGTGEIFGTSFGSLPAYPSSDSSRKQSTIFRGYIEPTTMPIYGAEISVDVRSNSNDPSNGFLYFTIDSVDYVLSQDTGQFVLYDATNTTTIAHDSGTNSTGKAGGSVWEILKARVWINGTDLYVKCVSRTNSADVVAWKITGLTLTSFDALSVSGSWTYIDDLAYYEVESADLTGLTDDWNTGTYDFEAHLIEVPFIAKSGADQNTKYYESVASPDWTGSTSGLPGDISDGSDITYAEAGSDKIGWELHDGTNYIAPEAIPLEDKNSSPIIGGPIHGIAVYGWRVQDDNAQELKLQVHGPTAVKKSDGTTAHTIQTEQTYTDPGIIGQSGMVSHFWDFSGLTGSDGDPIDETVVPKLRVSMSL